MAKWTKLSEKRPEESGPYLVAVKDTDPFVWDDGQVADMSYVTVMQYYDDSFIFDDGQGWCFNALVEHPNHMGNELTHWMPLPKLPYLDTTSPTDGTIFTHTEAINIVELFEDILDKFGIDIPDPDREESENPARLYGMTYFDLVSNVEQIIIKILEKNSQGSKIVNYICDDGGSNDGK